MRVLRVIAAVLLAGVAASMALGIFTPFLAPLGRELDLSLAATSWLASGVSLVAGLTCLPVGTWADRHSLRRPFVLGLVVLAAAGAASAVADHVVLLIALRVGQGVGYTIVVVVGPALLVRLLSAERARPALALWGLCVPVGLALASITGGVLIAFGWRASVLASSAIALVAAGVALLALPYGAADSRGETARARGAAPWLLAVGFALIAMIGVAVLTLLPTFLSAVHGFAAADAGLVTGVVAASSALGSVMAAGLLRARAAPQQLLVAVPLMSAAAVAVFLAGSGGAVAAAAALMLFNGLAVSALFAMVPVVAGAGTAWATGALTQFGSLGTLLGPPVYAMVLEQNGWWISAPMSVLFAVLGFGCAVAALRFGRSSSVRHGEG